MLELAVIGFGNRARKYVSCLDGRAHVAGIVEPSAYCRSYAVRAYGIDESRCFESLDALIASGMRIDAAIIASPAAGRCCWKSRSRPGWKSAGNWPDSPKAAACPWQCATNFAIILSS